MENSGGITASLAGRYASALFDLALEKNMVSAIEGDLDALGQAIRESTDLAALIRNPQVTRDAAAKAMAGAGGDMSYAQAWQPHVVVDRELITGQNPFSDKALAKALLEQLESVGSRKN